MDPNNPDYIELKNPREIQIPWKSKGVTYDGLWQDPATGLLKTATRWYDAVDGLFASQDPLGFGGGQTNLSEFCGNSPTNATDPSGMAIAYPPSPAWLIDGSTPPFSLGPAVGLLTGGGGGSGGGTIPVDGGGGGRFGGNAPSQTAGADLAWDATDEERESLQNAIQASTIGLWDATDQERASFQNTIQQGALEVEMLDNRVQQRRDMLAVLGGSQVPVPVIQQLSGRYSSSVEGFNNEVVVTVPAAGGQPSIGYKYAWVDPNFGFYGTPYYELESVHEEAFSGETVNAMNDAIKQSMDYEDTALNGITIIVGTIATLPFTAPELLDLGMEGAFELGPLGDFPEEFSAKPPINLGDLGGDGARSASALSPQQAAQALENSGEAARLGADAARLKAGMQAAASFDEDLAGSYSVDLQATFKAIMRIAGFGN